MIAIETSIVVVLLLASVQSLFRDASARPALVLLAISLALIAFHLLSSHFRWQMLPAYFVCAALVAMAIWDVQPGSVVKYVAAAGSVVLLLLATVLAIGFPIRALPAPDGRFAVGTIDLDRERLPDPTEDDVVGSGPRRRLFVKVWYPASRVDGKTHRPETFWKEFADPGNFGRPVRLVAGYLKNMRTHSYPDVPVANDSQSFPVLFYSHSLISIAGDNTLLMESLASHGYIVVSVRDKDQNAERAALLELVPEEQKARNREYYARLSRDDVPRQERSQRSLAHFQDAGSTTTTVVRRAADVSFALDELEEILGSIPGCQGGRCGDPARIGVLGLSVGGAVTTELCKTDARCRAAVNMDGGQWGKHTLDPIEVPYLMLYSDLNTGTNDFSKEISGSNFVEHTVRGSKHTDYHDASVMLPGLRWFGVLGSIDGETMNREKNRRIVEFFDAHLRGTAGAGSD